MTASLGGPCAAGIGLIVVCTVGLFVVGTWPAYFLSVLRISERAQARIRRTVTRLSVGLALCATAAAVALLAVRPC